MWPRGRRLGGHTHRVPHGDDKGEVHPRPDSAHPEVQGISTRTQDHHQNRR